MADNNKTIDNINLRLTDFDNIPEGFQFYEWASRINGVGSKTDSSDTRSDFQKIAESINTLGSNVNEINSKLGTFSTLKFEKVTTLPDITNADSNKIYLVPAENSEVTNVYDEYIFVDNSFELVGTTAIDFDKIKVQYATEDAFNGYKPEDIEDGVIYLVEQAQTETLSFPPTDNNKSEYVQAYNQFTKEIKGNVISNEFRFNNMAPLEASSNWTNGVASVSGKQNFTDTYRGRSLNGYSVIDFSGECAYSGQITLQFASYYMSTNVNVSYFLYNKSGIIYKSNITSAINQSYDESTLYNRYSINSSTGVYYVNSSFSTSSPLTINIPFNYADRLVVVVRCGMTNDRYNYYSSTNTSVNNCNLFNYKVFLSDLSKEVKYNTYSPSVHLNNQWYDMVADSTAIDSLVKDFKNFKKELEESYYNKDTINEKIDKIHDEIDSVAVNAQSPIVESIYVNGADLLYNNNITADKPSYIISHMLSTNMIQAINYCLINRNAILNTPGDSLSDEQIKYRKIFFKNGIRDISGNTTTSNYASKGYIETNLSINGKTSMCISYGQYIDNKYDGLFVYTIDAGDYILKVELVRYDQTNSNSLTADIGLRVVEIVGQINEIPLPVYQTYLDGYTNTSDNGYIGIGVGEAQLPAYILCNENNGIYDLGTLKVNSNVYRSLAMHSGFLKQNRKPVDMSNTFNTYEYFTNNPFDFSLTVANSKDINDPQLAQLNAAIMTKKFSIKDFEIFDVNKFYYIIFLFEYVNNIGDEDSTYEFINSITDLEIKQIMLKYVEINSNPDLSNDPTVKLELYEMIVHFMETRCAQYPLVLDSEGNHYILKYDLDIVEDASNVDEVQHIMDTLLGLYEGADYLDIPIYYKNSRLVQYDNSADKIDELGQSIDLIADEIGADFILNEDYPQEDTGSIRTRLSDLEYLTSMLVDDATAQDIPDGDTLLPLSKEITNDLAFPLESNDNLDYKDDSGITGDTVLPYDPDVDEITATISNIFN